MYLNAKCLVFGPVHSMNLLPARDGFLKQALITIVALFLNFITSKHALLNLEAIFFQGKWNLLEPDGKCVI